MTTPGLTRRCNHRAIREDNASQPNPQAPEATDQPLRLVVSYPRRLTSLVSPVGLVERLRYMKAPSLRETSATIATVGTDSAGSRPDWQFERLDILVIEGGVTGCGVALDAVTRALSTGLVEARDYASGTSSRSSKLIHGGLRYLEMLDFRLGQEAPVYAHDRHDVRVDIPAPRPRTGHRTHDR